MVAALIVLGVLSLLALAYCVLDVATSRPGDVRALPKWLWFVVLLLPVVGPASWLLAGRPAPAARRAAGPSSSRSPDDDEEFLRQLRRRADEQRRQAEMQRRRESDPRDEDRPA